MTKPITVRRSDGTWIVRAEGAILAESRRAIELREGDCPPVVYIPREDVAMALFEKSADRASLSPIGQASLFSFVSQNGEVRDAAWSYESPSEEAAEIAGHLAFHPDRITVQRR